MEINTKLAVVLSVGISVLVCSTRAHEVPVHRAITINAAQTVYDNGASFKSFVDVIATDFSYVGLENR